MRRAKLISIGSSIVLRRVVIDSWSSLEFKVRDISRLEVVCSSDIIEFEEEVEHIVIAGIGGFVVLSEAWVSLRRVQDVLSCSVEDFRSQFTELHVTIAPLLESQSATNVIRKLQLDRKSTRLNSSH